MSSSCKQGRRRPDIQIKCVLMPAISKYRFPTYSVGQPTFASGHAAQRGMANVSRWLLLRNYRCNTLPKHRPLLRTRSNQYLCPLDVLEGAQRAPGSQHATRKLLYQVGHEQENAGSAVPVLHSIQRFARPNPIARLTATEGVLVQT